MKNLIKILIVTVGIGVAFASSAQTAETVKLNQTPGVFEQTELKLEAGKSYIFDVTNEGVDHKVGFVIAPKGKTDQKNHIKEGYLAKTIANGESSQSQTVTLEKGEYVYFCPMNPTPQYTIIVE